MSRTVNAAGLALITSFESFRSAPYQDEGGIWTQGYGHTQGVTADSPSITQGQAMATLQEDLTEFVGYVLDAITVDLNDNQLAALVSLTENVGTGPLHSGLGQLLNQGAYDQSADHFLLWNKEHIDGELVEVDGLTRRRTAERALFLTPANQTATS